VNHAATTLAHAMPEPLSPQLHCRTAGRSKTMRMIFILLVASVLSILAFKHANNSLGGGELMASPMDAAQES
jgi:hypothetical protein